MKREIILKHEFVEYIPDDLKDKTIYVSMAFAIAAHKCCCGCGNQVITPLSPIDWSLIFNGETISLYPSIGNWNFPCQSHYWIEYNTVKWASRWSRKQINAARTNDAFWNGKYFYSSKNPTIYDKKAAVEGLIAGKSKESIWRKLKRWMFKY